MSSLAEARTWDVVIIGAGPAGCVLASRLSEDPARHVLLLEAGRDDAPGEEHDDVRGAYAPLAMNNPAYHWQGLTAETGADPGDGSSRASGPYLQASGVGGASNINGMGADRGHPGDFDEWEEMGAEGWNWEQVLPYFRRLETDLDFTGANAAPMHGDSGPIPIKRLPRIKWGPFCTALGTALERRGYPYLDDYNGDFRDGYASAPTNCVERARISTSMAYLTKAVRARPNLTILPGACAERLLLEGKKATGAVVRTADGRINVRGKEIIVSGGALQSPTLLLRSGIGPAAELDSLGIKPVLDLPGVGQNLQNHPYISLATFLPAVSGQPADNPLLLQNWVRFSSNHPGCATGDMHILLFNRSAWHALGRRVGALGLSVFKAYSKGTVRLKSADAGVEPDIRFNLLDDPRDLERLETGTRFLIDLLDDPAVASRRDQVFEPLYKVAASLSRPSKWNAFKARAIVAMLDVTPFRRAFLAARRINTGRLRRDDAYLRAFVRQQVKPQFHVCGTCKIGAVGDPLAVTDPNCRVRGIEGLRVVDASVFPSVPRANTHLTVIMVAEKVAAEFMIPKRRRPAKTAAS